MNTLFDLESQLRTSARKLFESVTAENVDGLIIERDIERARTMQAGELAAHIDVLATLASKVVGCEVVVAEACRVIADYRRLGIVKDDEYEGCKTFWWVAHRSPPAIAA